MSKRSRIALPLSLSSCLALGGLCVVLAAPGDAAPLPTEYAATATADLWHVNQLDRDLTDTAAATATDLSVLRVDGRTSSTGSDPRSRAIAANLAGAGADGQAARRGVISEATRTTDTSGPIAGIAPAGTLTGTLDVGQATLGARGRWVGGQSCLTTADGLTDATAVGSGASLAPAVVPDGDAGTVIGLPPDLPTIVPTAVPSSSASGLPTSSPSVAVPSITASPTVVPSDPTSDLPLPTLPPLPSLPTPSISIPGLASGEALTTATHDVVLASLAAGTVQQRVDLPVRNDPSGDDRGVRAQAIGTVKDTSAPALTLFGGEVEVRLNGPARLTAYADGVHPSVVDWVPPTVSVTSVGQGATYALPASGSPITISYSLNKAVTVTLTAGTLTQFVTQSGLAASGHTSVLHLVVRNGDAVALDADLMPMTVEAQAPGGGVECPAPDTDGDGLSDDLETQIGTNLGVKDTDRDRLTDGQEYLKYRTNPLKPDSDKDKLSDGVEVKKYKTLPLKPDTDKDNLTDGREVKKYRTNPREKDTDGDGVSDGVEIRRGTDPLHR